MNKFNKLFVFTLMNQNYAIDLSCVERGIHAVEITPVPEKLRSLMGMINVHGKIIPVLNIRKKFNLPDREIDIDDYIIIVNISDITAAFIADAIVGVMDISDDEFITSDEILPHLQNVEGVVKLNGGMIFIHDLVKTLSIDVKEEIDILDGIKNV